MAIIAGRRNLSGYFKQKLMKLMIEDIIIPARKGSKRIKNKNIKLFFNKPILFYIEKAIDQKFLAQSIYLLIVRKFLN